MVGKQGLLKSGNVTECLRKSLSLPTEYKNKTGSTSFTGWRENGCALKNGYPVRAWSCYTAGVGSTGSLTPRREIVSTVASLLVNVECGGKHLVLRTKIQKLRVGFYVS